MPNLTANGTFVFTSGEVDLTTRINATSIQSAGSIGPYYPLEFRLLATVLHSFLAIIGIIGNIMVITVVLRVRGMVSPTNCYLLSLACSDCLFFVSAMPIELTGYHLPKGVYLFGVVGCKIFTFLPYLAINASSLAIAAFTIERYIGICHPMRAKYICTVRRAKLIICAIWLFSIAYNSPWLVLTGLEELHYQDWPDAKRCYYKLSRNAQLYKIQYLVDFTTFYFLPLLLYFALYGRIAKIVMAAKFRPPLSSIDRTSQRGGITFKVKTVVRSHKLSEQSNGSGCGVAPCANSNSGSCVSESSVSGARINRNRFQVIKMLVIVVVVFALCWLPYRSLVVYNSFSSKSWMNLWYLFFAKTLIVFNSAVNPILYSILSDKFHRAFVALIRTPCCRKDSSGYYTRATLIRPATLAGDSSTARLYPPLASSGRMSPSPGVRITSPTSGRSTPTPIYAGRTTPYLVIKDDPNSNIFPANLITKKLTV